MALGAASLPAVTAAVIALAVLCSMGQPAAATMPCSQCAWTCSSSCSIVNYAAGTCNVCDPAYQSSVYQQCKSSCTSGCSRGCGAYSCGCDSYCSSYCGNTLSGSCQSCVSSNTPKCLDGCNSGCTKHCTSG